MVGLCSFKDLLWQTALSVATEAKVLLRPLANQSAHSVDNLFIFVTVPIASSSQRLLAMFGEVALWLRVNLFAERRPLNICVTLLDCSERLPRWPDLP
jgi:hypothetical protein